MAKLPELWANLRAEGSGAVGGMTMRLRTSASGVRLFAGLEIDSRFPALVLEISKESKPKDLSRITTRTFDAQVVSLPGLYAGRIAICILLKANEFEDLFAILGEDIVQAVEASKDETSAVKAVVKRVERWRKFIDRGRRRLTEEEVRGLLGELALLGRCIAFVGSHTALDAWQGSGGLRDFELPSIAVEVKTYQAATGATVHIGDPEQLEPASGRPLFLATLQLSRTENAGWTLATAVNRLVELLAGDIEEVEKLWDRLADQGYLACHADLYPEQYILDRARLYRIAEGFPRIASATVPPGVECVQFAIRLAAIQKFAVQTDEVLGAASLLEATA